MLEEVVNLAALVVSLSGGEHTHLGLFCEVLADVGHWKHYLLHSAIVTHNLGKIDPTNRLYRFIFTFFNKGTEKYDLLFNLSF